MHFVQLSTTIGLIERPNDPVQGDVLIGDVSIKKSNIGTLKQRIGVITQEPVLFSTISIAHRLNTVRNCDQIYVGREGVVSKSGTHDELVMSGGEYAAMVRAQELRQAVRIAEQGAEDDDEEDVDELIGKELREQAIDLKATTTRQTVDSVKNASVSGSVDPDGAKIKQIDEAGDFYLLWSLIY
ncbi:ATP-binding cassette, sub B (MDR TAP), member, partial [Coemansia sp. S680]